MPELPEVEVTKLGIIEHIKGQPVIDVIIRTPKLRFPIPESLSTALIGQTLIDITRRSKYLLFEFSTGTMMVHLGMSGHLRLFDKQTPIKKHDHIDWIFPNILLRLNDARRFGSVLWHPKQRGDIDTHRQLQSLGIEPFSNAFNATYLYEQSKNKKITIKQALLNGKIVVGVGNIYCSESLFRAKIHPLTEIRHITRQQFERLADEIQQTLSAAIQAGGSTLKDFVNADGNKGYFQQQYFVYQRDGLPCLKCNTLIIKIIQGQRATFLCPTCQVAP